MKRLLMLIAITGLLTGCATTGRNNSMMTQLQTRVAELERQIESKDTNIEDLKYKVKDLSYNVQQLEDKVQTVKRRRAVTPSSASAAASDDDRIIRVPVDKTTVQRALKAAGFYSGAIDGKIGSGTKAAISQFQKDKGLKVDGLVGQQTWNALKTYVQ
ncbi:MAG: peptidoglycan-binding protein [Candidatus Omnitrophota bacterium]